MRVKLATVFFALPVGFSIAWFWWLRSVVTFAVCEVKLAAALFTLPLSVSIAWLRDVVAFTRLFVEVTSGGYTL